jgi:hypothetical protein
MATASPSFTFSGVVTPLAKKTVATATSFSATLDDISGVTSVAWSIVSTDDSTLPANYTLVTSGIKGSTVTLTSLGLGTAALLSCTINGGIDPQTEAVSTAMTATALFEVLLTNTGTVGVVGETTQRDGVFGSLVFLNGLARLVSTAASSTVASITAGTGIAVTGTVTVPIVSATASSGAAAGTMSAADYTKLSGVGAGATVASIGAGTSTTVGGTAAIPVINVTASSGAVAGSMSAAHYTLVNNATSSATANTIGKRGASGEIAYGAVTADNLIVGGSGDSTFSSTIALTPFVDTYAANVAMRGKDGGKHNITLTGNIVFDPPTFYSNGARIIVFIRQGGAGSYTATWTTGAGGFYFPTGYSGTLVSAVAGTADVFIFEHTTLPSSHWLCVGHFDYTTP